MDAYIDGSWWIRLIFQRGLGAIYVLAFVSALNQFPALLGERGLLPVPHFIARVSFWKAPSAFHLYYSDRFFRGVAWSGLGLSLLATTGVAERGPVWLTFAVWLLLWLSYLSIVNVGQTFYSFGWESMLLEAGFFAIFLGPSQLEASPIPLLALRWMLFRTEFGAGLIKLRHDSCWRDLTCLYYHYETQPLPNALSWHFHRLPRSIHRTGVLFSHFVQLVAPFGLFAPQPIAAIAGTVIIGHQLLLIVSGNYAWLNWLTVVLGFTAFDDAMLSAAFALSRPTSLPNPLGYQLLLYALAVLTVVCSVRPALNLASPHQRMNYNYNPFHIVNAYGAFGSVTRERYEIVLEGRSGETGEWKEYGFRAKPGAMTRRPPQVAPYHLRLDWLMWFLPLRGVHRRPEPWFLELLDKLLDGERATTQLLRDNPFTDRPPSEIRAHMYRYEFTTADERAKTGAIWKREPVAPYAQARKD